MESAKVLLIKSGCGRHPLVTCLESSIYWMLAPLALLACEHKQAARDPTHQACDRGDQVLSKSVGPHG
jgi:hypothetical protein